MKKHILLSSLAIVVGLCLAKMPTITNKVCTCLSGNKVPALDDSLQTHIDFDVSMQADQFQQSIQAHNTHQQVGMSGPKLMDFFKNLYDKNAPSRLTIQTQPRVPKILHQIWIGKAVPQEFEQFQETWQELHPDWEYKLWTQHDIDSLSLVNADLIKQARNPAEISDLLRYEILYQQGGVYVDLDFECIKSLDVLNHLYDFYIGIQSLDTNSVQLGSGLIGATPGHPILQHMISSVRETWNKTYDIPNRTGPALFTKSFIACADQGNIDVALPASYFYPFGVQDTEIKKEEWTNNGAFAIHYWAKSWLQPSFRPDNFKSITA